VTFPTERVRAINIANTPGNLFLNNLIAFLKYLLGIIRSDEKKKIECNARSSEFLGAVGNLSFGKLCTCIHKSEPSCWKSSWGESFDSI
jgi:hypothetical protein